MKLLPIISAAFLFSFGTLIAAEEGDAIAGAELAEQMRQLVPAENASWSGTMIRRLADRRIIEIPVSCRVFVEADQWTAIYTVQSMDNTPAEKVVIIHHQDAPTEYHLWRAKEGALLPELPRKLKPSEADIPFAGSDFLLSDFGMEFFHWPTQRLLKGQMRRGQPCHVLESVSPRIDGSGYFRVRSWITKEHLGLLQAEAYDANGKLIKDFSPGSFRKGQLEDMKIQDLKKGTSTKLEFDLDE